MATSDNADWIGNDGFAENGTNTYTENGNSTTVTGVFTTDTWDATAGGTGVSEFGAAFVDAPITADYTFSNPVQDLKFTINHVNSQAPTYDDYWTIAAYDASGNLIPAADVIAGLSNVQDELIIINPDGTVSINANGTIANDITVGLTGPISQLVLTFEPGPEGVMTGGSGISDLSFSIPPATNDYTVEGTVKPDLIDAEYRDDPERDMIDANDHSDRSNDDLVLADAGNDTVLSGAGNDTVDGGSGDDSLMSGEGNDTVIGGTGNDFVDGGAGDDVLSGGDGDDALFGGWEDAGADLIDGGDGNDFAMGGWGNDTVIGGKGNDWLDGGWGDDSISGGAGEDRMTGHAGNDTIDGGEGHDTLTGGAGKDLLIGGDGADVIWGGSGDTIIGGEGGKDVDTLNVSDVASIAYTGAESGVVFFNDGTTLTFSEIETVNILSNNYIYDGTAGDDAIGQLSFDADGDWIDNDDALGGGEHDSIRAGAGNDIVWAGEGDDTVDGGSGQDTIHGDVGNDSLFGGTGDDDISGDAGNDTILGQDGSDTLRGGDGDDVLDGDDAIGGADVIFGDAGNDTIDGGAGNDTVYAGADNDSVHGGTGDDWITGEAGDDTVYGGAGNDSVFGAEGNDVIYGDAGNDSMEGWFGDDSMHGGAGDDYIDGGDGADLLTGGDGDDILLGGNDMSADTLIGGAGNDTLGAGDGDDILSGGTGADSMFGGSGDDIFLLEDDFGDDTIQGWEEGETSGDSIDGSALTQDVQVNLTGFGSASDPESGTISNGTDTALFSQIEAITLGSGDDLVIGSTGNDTITIDTGAGADTVSGGAGDDAFNVGAADGDVDTVVMADGGGDDTISGFEGPIDNGDGTFTGQDQLDVSGLTSDGTTPVTIHDVTVGDDGAGNAVLNFPGGESITLVGISPASLNSPAALNALGIPGSVDGTAGDDIMGVGYTDTHGDVIDGADGMNDTISDGAGHDTVSGGTGADVFLVGAGNDSIAGNEDDDIFLVSDGFGNDTLLGGDQSPVGTNYDTIDLTALSNPVSVIFSGPGAGTITDSVTGDVITFSGIEQLILTNGNDTVDATLDDGYTYIQTRDGNDYVQGSSGNDVYDDEIFGPNGQGNDTFIGGDGDDEIWAGTDDDLVIGGAGNDTLAGQEGADTLQGDAGNDLLDVGGNDTAVDTVVLTAGGGDDTVTGFEAPIDTGGGVFVGQDQFDVSGLTDMFGNPVNVLDVMVGNDGAGNAVLFFPNGESVTLTGVSPAAVSSHGALEAMGIPGTNYIVEGTASCELINPGYSGDPDGDMVDSFDNATGDNDDFIQAGGGNDTIGAGWGNDFVDAGTGDDQVFAETGNDTVLGGDGNDFVLGEAGDDSLLGKAGNDTLIGGDGNDAIDGGTQDDSLLGEAGDDTLQGGDGADYLHGGTGNDSMEGGSGNDTIIAGAGNDTIQAGAGDDSVLGGAGNDVIFGYEGNDTVDGGDGDDLINTRTSPGTGLPDQGYVDPANPAISYPGDPNPGNDLDSVIGGAGDDTILTGDDDDTISGGLGNDSIDAGFDDDLVHGDEGNDTIHGNEGSDTIFGGDGDDLIYGSLGPSHPDYAVANLYEQPNDVSDAAPTNNEDYLSGGAGNDTIYGQDDNDTLLGGDGDDILDGGLDHDILIGGAGSDLMIGGAGNDSIIVAQGDTAEGGDGDDYFFLADYGEAGAGTIHIIGGEGGETSGDTLQLTSDVSFADITFTNTDDTAGGLSGNFTMSDGTVVHFSEIENIICFTTGARILTSHGERPIETLRVGDRVVTRDHGLRPIRWIGKRTVPGIGRFAPISISPSVTQPGEAGLLVSPQHRILFTGYRAELLFGESEVLIPAKYLVDGRDVRVREQPEVTYIHIMFDRHEVIYADGIATESFCAGETALDAVEAEAREELFAIFPELRSAAGRHRETARTCLKRREAALLRDYLKEESWFA